MFTRKSTKPCYWTRLPRDFNFTRDWLDEYSKILILRPVYRNGMIAMEGLSIGEFPIKVWARVAHWFSATHYRWVDNRWLNPALETHQPSTLLGIDELVPGLSRRIRITGSIYRLATSSYYKSGYAFNHLRRYLKLKRNVWRISHGVNDAESSILSAYLILEVQNDNLISYLTIPYRLLTIWRIFVAMNRGDCSWRRKLMINVS